MLNTLKIDGRNRLNNIAPDPEVQKVCIRNTEFEPWNSDLDPDFFKALSPGPEKKD